MLRQHSFHYASRSLRYRGAAFKERNYMKDYDISIPPRIGKASWGLEYMLCKKYVWVCKNCKYHDDFSWVCFNPESEKRADFTDNKDSCTEWESREDNPCGKKI